jgi:hypothetical protein
MSESETTDRTIHAPGIRLAGVLPAYTRHEGVEWDWVAEMPLYIPPGHRIIAEVSKEGVFSMRREKL